MNKEEYVYSVVQRVQNDLKKYSNITKNDISYSNNYIENEFYKFELHYVFNKSLFVLIFQNNEFYKKLNLSSSKTDNYNNLINILVD